MTTPVGSTRPVSLLALVAAGGFLGAAARMGAYLAITGAGNDPTLAGSRLPSWVATYTVNVIGCVLMGVLLARIPATSPWRAFLGFGVLGAFTTFSTFGADVMGLVSEGDFVVAGIYLVGSVVTCLLGVVIGERLGRRRRSP